AAGRRRNRNTDLRRRRHHGAHDAGRQPRHGEINPTATVIAIQQGADLKIGSDNVQTVAEFIWAVKPDSPIKTAADLKGKEIGYTNPRSTSQALAILVLEKAGLKPDDARSEEHTS